MDIDVPSITEKSQPPIFRFEKLWLFALTTNHYSKKLLLPRLEETQNYRYEYKYVEDTWTIWPVSRAVSVRVVTFMLNAEQL